MLYGEAIIAEEPPKGIILTMHMPNKGFMESNKKPTVLTLIGVKTKHFYAKQNDPSIKSRTQM